MPVRLCVCAGVAPPSRYCCRRRRTLLCSSELCVAASQSRLCLDPALRALPWAGAPRTVCRVLLNCGPQCLDPVTSSDNGGEINSAPPHHTSRPVIQPMRKQHGGSASRSCSQSGPKKNTHSHTNKYNYTQTHTQLLHDTNANNKHSVKGHTTKTHNSFHGGQIWIQLFHHHDGVVASGCGRHGDGGATKGSSARGMSGHQTV